MRGFPVDGEAGDPLPEAVRALDRAQGLAAGADLLRAYAPVVELAAHLSEFVLRRRKLGNWTRSAKRRGRSAGPVLGNGWTRLV